MFDTTRPEVAFAVRMVREAAKLAHQVQAEMKVEGIAKSDKSPVTVADYAAQAVLGHALEETFPGDVLVGEESADGLRTEEGSDTLQLVTQFVGRCVPGARADEVCTWIDRGTADASDRFWTLDPVDGTKGYLRGDQYAVALARIEDGQVTIGALGCPRLGQDCLPDKEGLGALLVAVRGEGTWCTTLAEEGPFRQLKVSPCADATQARMMRSVEAGHTHGGQIDEIAELLGVEVDPVRMDSQAKYATLAAGGGELLFRLLSPKKPDYKEKIWDQAAGSIVLEESGGHITDLQGKPLDFTQGRTLAANTGVFASNATLHGQGLDVIAKVCGL